MRRKIAFILSCALIIGSIPLSFAELRSNMDRGITLKPLVILMDFPDYDYTDLEGNERITHESRHEYDSYEKDLYEDILFGTDTYTGIDGEEYMTIRSYYDKMSHGKLDLDGRVYGWYTADYNARRYGEDRDDNGVDHDEASDLVREALEKLMDSRPQLDLSQFDRMDPNDLNNNGINNEPDGEIDFVLVIHAGRGEEWDGGSLGSDAIWPHFNSFSYDSADRSERPEIDYANTSIFMNDYAIVEQDFPTNLVAHELAHYLGVSDLYRLNGVDTVEQYSNMASGYPGEVIGSLIPSVGALGRQKLQEIHGGDWADSRVYDLSDIGSAGLDLMLSAASSDNRRYNDLIRIDLPEKTTYIVDPPSGSKCYFTGIGNDLNNTMSIDLDLTGASRVKLEFQAWYDIDPEYDYVSVQVRKRGRSSWEPVRGNITTTANPNDETPNDPTDRNPGHGITNDSNDTWVDAEFDLSKYAGENVELKFNWWTDGNTLEKGMYIDDIAIKADGSTIVYDGAEGTPQFTLNGFEVSDGTMVADHYYLLEWRNHEGVDENLTRITKDFDTSPANRGLVVWYIDELYTGPFGRYDQETSEHPGHCYASVIDAGQYPVVYRYYGEDEVINDKDEYQRHDAAFSLRNEPEFRLDWPDVETIDVYQMMQPVFDDSYSYYDEAYDEIGVIQPEYGLKFFVLEENEDSTEAQIHVKKSSGGLKNNTFSSDITCAGVELDNEELIVKVNDSSLKDEATAVFINERFPNIIQTDVILEKENSVFSGQLPLGGRSGNRMILGNSYFSGVGNNLDNSMTAFVNLRNVQSAELTFKTWFDIEPSEDFASVKVRERGSSDWESIEGNITVRSSSRSGDPRYRITKDSTREWIDASFDLSDYIGMEIEFGIFFETNGKIDEYGMFVDDIAISDNRYVIFEDNAEGPAQFNLNGFELSEDTYRLAYIVFEKRDGSLSALYNSRVYGGYGVDLDLVSRALINANYNTKSLNENDVDVVSGGAIEVPVVIDEE